MSRLSRRGFLGYSLGLAGGMLFPASVLARTSATSDSTPAQHKETLRAMAAIQARIDALRKEGQAFAADTLPADAEDQWQRLIEHYFQRKEMTSISVNAANLCPSLKCVDEMVAMVQVMLAMDISFPMRGQLAQASLGKGLGAVKQWFGLHDVDAEADHLLALVANATQGNNFINNGLVTSGFFDPQKHNIVVWDVNHPTNFDAWHFRAATQGWPKGCIRTLQTNMFSHKATDKDIKAGAIPSDPAGEDEIVSALLNLVDKNTRLVTLSWQSNECGMLLPMKRIVEELRAVNKELHIHADSAQTFGVLDLKLADTGVDSITGSFHKWPCGPKMVGILYMNLANGAAERFTPSVWGYDEHIMTPTDYGYPADTGRIDPDTKRFSYLGQQNDATLVATWLTALFHTGAFHPAVSPEKLEARIHHLGSVAKEALLRELPKVYPELTPNNAYKWISTPTSNDDLRSSVFLFKSPQGVAAGDVMQHVYDKHGFAMANLTVKGHQLLRVSPTFCNTEQDVQDIVAAVVDVLQAMQKGTLASLGQNRGYA